MQTLLLRPSFQPQVFLGVFLIPLKANPSVRRGGISDGSDI